jgi:hypothetical protein
MYMIGGDGHVHVQSLLPQDALGMALWLLGFGLWPVAISPSGDLAWPSPGKSPIGVAGAGPELKSHRYHVI